MKTIIGLVPTIHTKEDIDNAIKHFQGTLSRVKEIATCLVDRVRVIDTLPDDIRQQIQAKNKTKKRYQRNLNSVF